MDINFWAVLGAAIVSLIVGFLWYSPLFFGKKWSALMGLTPEKINEIKTRGMAKTYVINFVLDLLTAYVLASIVIVTSITALRSIFILVLWIWVGFSIPVLMGSVLWENKSWKLFFINAGYKLVSLAAMGIVFGIWK